MSLTLGSFFDGLGGWLVASAHAGVVPKWRSEIDDFPAAVAGHHFPDVPNLGDITKIKAEDLEPVDIICAGSPCFVAGTNILTYDGVKAVEDVAVGDAVLGDDCKWHEVVKTMVNPASSIYTIKAQGLLETKATANHPIYVRHMKWHYPTYEDGRRGRERVFSKPEYVAVKNLKKGDFIGFPILQTAVNMMGVTPEEAWLVGRYIADGYVNNSPRKDRPEWQYNHKVIFCIGKGKVEHFKAHVDKYHVCLKKDVTVTKGEIVSERLMQLCLMCGHGAGNKEIPGVFLNLPKGLLKSLLDGYMSGDGCKIKGRNKATTISKNLALSLQTAVHKVYRVPAKIYFAKRPPKAVIQGREINQHDTYQVVWLDGIPKQSNATLIDEYIWQPIKSITKEDIETSVYNFEVEDVHSYTANGMMVHNCQDLSVAGKRAGLEGERSGLFRTAIRLVHNLRARTGKPRYFVWENVPGAFSSNKGHDFRAVLEEISQTAIPMPGSGKWANAGMVSWGHGSLAWRVLDAQYWGVPQRRKRIFLVADFAGQSAGEILFEPEGLHGHTSESERKGQDFAADVGTSTESTGRVATLTMRSGKPGGGKGPLVKEELSLALSTQNTQTVFTGGFKYRNGAKARSIGYADEQAPTLETSQNTAIVFEPGIASRDGGHVYNGTAPTLRANPVDNAPAICLNDQGGSVMDVSDKAGTLRAESHGHEPCVCLAGNIIGRQVQNGGNGVGAQEDISYTLNTVARHAVAVGYRASGFQSYSEDKVAGTLRAEGGTAGGGSETFVISEKSDA